MGSIHYARPPASTYSPDPTYRDKPPTPLPHPIKVRTDHTGTHRPEAEFMNVQFF
jgi:hypothetical protein